MNKKLLALLLLIIVAVFVMVSCLFTVPETRYALVFKFGQWQRTVSEPGLHWKLPTPFENVVYLDRRIQTIESRDTERIQTSEKKNLIIDSYIKWRIVDPLKYYTSFGSSDYSAQSRLGALIRDALNASVNTRTVRAVIAQERDVVMAEILKTMEERARPFGIQVVDVRLKRIEFSAEVSDSVYARMRAERKQEANNLRATGYAESEKIRAEADRKVQEILAEATAKSQEIRGQGDATAASIYANAYNKDLEFFKLYRSLEAYKESFKQPNDMIVVDPESEFFNFFHQSQSK
ncbi:protease modulator HflC [Basilea psittacipulmonis]|uniref:Protein HflC n=1 Tax=Basilea psittacipulmonis DSM 24701 TaxID=1072685 RepID=A0A077DER6_9BURK|nr:protease modulator HflC [Basilea psittacipulmonis]AIL32656.1 membrane protein [Basilea psittacipulmonis DSM 24701]